MSVNKIHHLSSDYVPHDNQHALSIINYGISCNCYIALNTLGLLESLNNEGVGLTFVLIHPQKPLLLSVFRTLQYSKLVKKVKGKYFFTHSGRDLFEQFGLLRMLFEGYADLLANQVSIAKGTCSNTSGLINGEIIAKASVDFSHYDLRVLHNKFFEAYNPIGTVCDLGCGNAEKLVDIQHLFGNPGLGIEIDGKVVESVREKLDRTNNQNIEVRQGDISKLDCVWDSVTVVMQHYVLHDFVPSSKCVNILNSYLKNFPNMEYFVFVDITAPSSKDEMNMPGFDYIHGLQGKVMRTYKETIDIFEQSNFSLIEEFPVEKMPCTYVWVLKT